MFEIMKKLITARFYATKEEAQTKLNVFFAVGQITDIEYVELTELVNTVYA